MKKPRRLKGKRVSPEPRSIDNGALLHFRLCHICLYLNEAANEIVTCKKCGEPFSKPEDPHGDADFESAVKEATTGDPFHDWDQDTPEENQVVRLVTENADEDESSFHDSEMKKAINGLRVRW